MGKIGIRIKEERNKQKIRQKDLSQLVGISNTYLCDIEKGRTSPSLETLKKIADVLKIKVGILLEEC